ncbi:serine protease [Isosphaeraceae bacterium EP7]
MAPIGVLTRGGTYGVASSAARIPESEFDRARSSVAPAVFEIVAIPPDGDPRPAHRIGSAFLISRKHRLLATAAHVADDSINYASLVAIRNGEVFRYKIDRIWYSPDTLRRFDLGLHEASQYPGDGDLVYPTDDVAVVHLAGGGPDLPVECTLAGDAELHTLADTPVATIGYSKTGRTPASYTETLTRSIGYGPGRIPDEAAKPSSRHWVRATNDGLDGTSGSPIFLVSGKVVALASINLDSRAGNGEWAEEMRVDVIRKILRYHEIERPANLDHSPEYLAIERERDRVLAGLRRTVRLSVKGESLWEDGSYSESIRLSQAAIAIKPDYGAAYLRMCRALYEITDREWDTTSTARRIQLANRLIFYAKCSIILLNDESFHYSDFRNTDWFLGPRILLADSNYFHFLGTGDAASLRANIASLDRALLEGPHVALDNLDVARLLGRRASSKERLGDSRGALEDIEMAAEIMPDDPDVTGRIPEFLARNPTLPPSLKWLNAFLPYRTQR